MKHDRVEQHLCFVLMGKNLNWEIQQNFLWLFCEYLTVCTCADVFLCVFCSDLTYIYIYKYTKHATICFNCWCGVGRLLIYFWCGPVSACAWLITLFQGQLTVSFRPTSPVMSSFCFFFLSLTPLSLPCILLACNNLPWTPTPIIPSSFPLKPSKNNKHSLRTLSR